MTKFGNNLKKECETCRKNMTKRLKNKKLKRVNFQESWSGKEMRSIMTKASRRFLLQKKRNGPICTTPNQLIDSSVATTYTEALASHRYEQILSCKHGCPFRNVNILFAQIRESHQSDTSRKGHATEAYCGHLSHLRPTTSHHDR